MSKFNQFFIEKEEDSVIKLQELSDRVKDVSNTEELQALWQQFVDFHGEAPECYTDFQPCHLQ